MRPPHPRRRNWSCFDVRAERLEQVSDAFAMFRADRDRVAEPEADRRRDAALGRRCPRPCCATTMTGVVSARSQRPISSSSGVRPSRASMRNSAASASRTAASVCCAHPARKRVRILILKPRRVDHPEVEPEQLGVALAPVASHAGPVVDQRQALADKAVEQRGLADVGPADDRDGRRGMGDRSARR